MKRVNSLLGVALFVLAFGLHTSVYANDIISVMLLKLASISPR